MYPYDGWEGFKRSKEIQREYENPTSEDVPEKPDTPFSELQEYVTLCQWGGYFHDERLLGGGNDLKVKKS